MAVAWGAVRAHLAASLPAIVGSSVKVYDGPVVTAEAPMAYLTIGSQPSGPESAGTFTQVTPPDGFASVETGTVLCELGAIDGTASVPSVFASFDLIAAYLHANQTLGGVLFPGSTVTVGAEVTQYQTQSGATQQLLLSVTYQTRIP